MKPLILIQLNEVNFDVAAEYIKSRPGLFLNISRLMARDSIVTTSETKYELLEPWIQWPSVYTGLSFSGHGIFRLGDAVNARHKQIYEYLDDNNFSVGAICPMNATNRVANCAYFIPDPWSDTPSDGSFWSRNITSALKQVVNDNASSKVSFRSAITLAAALCRFARLKNYFYYARLAITSWGKPWKKALLLDLFIHDFHLACLKKWPANFSSVFFNAGAHIQHHYFFNSLINKSILQNPSWYINEIEDPVFEFLQLYDRIIGDYINRSDIEYILTTGLSQIPFDDSKFYYRLCNHEQFIAELGISFAKIHTRMTRDFFITFNSEQELQKAQSILSAITAGSRQQNLFGEIEKKPNGLFVVLDYAEEITSETEFFHNGQATELMSKVSFVALKNGMHCASGFAFFSEEVSRYAPSQHSHVKDLFKCICSYFGLNAEAFSPM